MAIDSWLVRVKSALSPTATGPNKTIGILCFEVATIMSKLIHLWRSLSDNNLLLLRRDSISLPGVRKLVSDDDAFLLSLACAELTDTLRLAADGISLVLSHRCTDQRLRQFHRRFHDDDDDDRWVMGWKEMDAKVTKMEKLVTSTGELYRELDRLVDLEQCLKRLSPPTTNSGAVRQKIGWKKQEVKNLKQTSLWGKSFDSVTLLLVRSTFTVLARIKQVFHISNHESPPPSSSPPLPPRLSVSAAVHPSTDRLEISNEHSAPCSPSKNKAPRLNFFQYCSATLVRPPTTLGAVGLAIRYAIIVLILEKMIKSPRSIGPDARDDLYALLPASLRATLRTRLRQVVGCPADDVRLVGEWRAALGMIVDWLVPLAQNTVRWQSERGFERRGGSTTRSGVLVLQTLHFAVTEKAEAAVAELLVGLNYVWRFEIEMAVKAAKAQAPPVSVSNG